MQMSTAQIPAIIAPKVTAILDHFRQGVESWTKAGELLVEMLDENPHAYDYILAACPTMNAAILGKLEAIGRKTLHPQLLLTSGPGVSRMEKLPISMQERLLTEPVPLVVMTDNGPDILLVKAKDMSPDQVRQVFDRDRIRTEGEQRTILAEQMSRKAVSKNTPKSVPWRIKGRKVEILEPVTLTDSELFQILAQIRA